MGTDEAPSPRQTGRFAAGRAKRRDQLVPLLGYLAALVALVAYALISGDQRFVATGDSYPGTLTSCAEPVGYFTAALAGAMCLGGLCYIVTTARPDAKGVIDPPAFRI
ncbi:MAG: cytochrome c oxidase assembly protein, partial [Actinobacteria bacterium]|nr:cytochrome c oxidase assembly protein [Actinomycetota bacterium]